MLFMSMLVTYLPAQQPSLTMCAVLWCAVLSALCCCCCMCWACYGLLQRVRSVAVLHAAVACSHTALGPWHGFTHLHFTPGACCLRYCITASSSTRSLQNTMAPLTSPPALPAGSAPSTAQQGLAAWGAAQRLLPAGLHKHATQGQRNHSKQHR